MSEKNAVCLIDEKDDLSRFSDGYIVAMKQIQFELQMRLPEYRDLNHYNWSMYHRGAPDIKTRMHWTINAIVCFLLRAPAILAHHILGARDPDSYLNQFEPVDDLISLLFAKTPSYYISSHHPIWFNLYRNPPTLGYQASIEEIEWLMEFAQLGDMISE